MNAAGARLECATCGSQALVIAAGAGTLECCGAAMGSASEPRDSAVPAGPAAAEGTGSSASGA